MGGIKHPTQGCCHPMVYTTQQTLGGDGLYGGYAIACVRLDARHGVRCGWMPALGELRWLTVSGGGSPQQRPLLVWSPAMAGVRLGARHGGCQVSRPPWRACSQCASLPYTLCDLHPPPPVPGVCSLGARHQRENSFPAQGGYWGGEHWEGRRVPTAGVGRKCGRASATAGPGPCGKAQEVPHSSSVLPRPP